MANVPVTPADYLPIARKMLENREEIAAALDLAHEERDVGDADHADAAAREAVISHKRAVDDLKTLRIDPVQVATDLTPRSLAWRLAVAGSISRRIPEDRRCEHAQASARRPLLASLSSRWMFCRECAPRLAPRFGLTVDDDRCDVCDRPAIQFSEFWTTIGPLHLTRNICGLCRHWFEGLQRGGNH